jgi:hypothetical protein
MANSDTKEYGQTIQELRDNYKSCSDHELLVEIAITLNQIHFHLTALSENIFGIQANTDMIHNSLRKIEIKTMNET